MPPSILVLRRGFSVASSLTTRYCAFQLPSDGQRDIHIEASHQDDDVSAGIQSARHSRELRLRCHDFSFRCASSTKRSAFTAFQPPSTSFRASMASTQASASLTPRAATPAYVIEQLFTYYARAPLVRCRPRYGAMRHTGGSLDKMPCQHLRAGASGAGF